MGPRASRNATSRNVRFCHYSASSCAIGEKTAASGNATQERIFLVSLFSPTRTSLPFFILFVKNAAHCPAVSGVICRLIDRAFSLFVQKARFRFLYIHDSAAHVRARSYTSGCRTHRLKNSHALRGRAWELSRSLSRGARFPLGALPRAGEKRHGSCAFRRRCADDCPGASTIRLRSACPGARAYLLNGTHGLSSAHRP